MLPEWDNRIVQRLCCACLHPLLAVLPHKLPKGDAVAGAADKSAPVKVQITVLRDGEGLQGQDAAAEVHKDASCGLGPQDYNIYLEGWGKSEMGNLKAK